eukprot:TRINITY_DN57079_c0_g1_i1.p1 TRINITY_DN57079_c0_g1~~TRINITY_DN57079_c0_g1_i1.p1  ORF type:complete len:373 (+),score=101.15 TRINITY_DN57079_c0_g1_i1:98-1216(+)
MEEDERRQFAKEEDPLQLPKSPAHSHKSALSSLAEYLVTGRLTTPDGFLIPGLNIRLSRERAIALGISVILIGGATMGGTLPMHTDDPAPYDRISSVVGWIYFWAWSVSFYPQLYFNWVRKSVVGMSFDYVFLNLIGFGCYAAYNVSYFWVDSIQHEYYAKHGSNNVVRENDVFFALHAELLTICTFAQIFIYERGPQKFHWPPIVATITAAFVFGAWVICNLHRVDDHRSPFTWLDWFLGLSWLKLGISIVKYVPQVWLNFTRKSTTGWNIWNVLLDFTGGSMSVAQILMDCWSQDDWSGIAGNPVKFGLGTCSMIFDTIFMIQHYCLYAENNRRIQAREDARHGGADHDDSDAGEEEPAFPATSAVLSYA